METHRKRHGQWGLSELGWLHSAYDGRALQDRPASVSTYGESVSAITSSAIACRANHGRISGEGESVLADGRLTDARAIPRAMQMANWIVVLRVHGQYYEGSSDYGYGPHDWREITAVQLSADEWEPALQQGDNVLNVHIPEGSRMSHDACRDSYAQAARVLRGPLPRPAVLRVRLFLLAALSAVSELLPVHSNILQFQTRLSAAAARLGRDAKIGARIRLRHEAGGSSGGEAGNLVAARRLRSSDGRRACRTGAGLFAGRSGKVTDAGCLS